MATPIKVALEAGQSYAWCACGLSKKQPFCDGSHKGTAFSPSVFVADKTGDKYMCVCKKSANPPFCDGSHSK